MNLLKLVQTLQINLCPENKQQVQIQYFLSKLSPYIIQTKNISNTYQANKRFTRFSKFFTLAQDLAHKGRALYRSKTLTKVILQEDVRLNSSMLKSFLDHISSTRFV